MWVDYLMKEDTYTDGKQIQKRPLPPSVTREMQIEITMTYHFILTRMTTIQKITIKK